MDISGYKIPSAASKPNIGTDSSKPGSVFSGRSISVKSDFTLESAWRKFLFKNILFFKQKQLKYNKQLKSLFPSCASLKKGQQFINLAKGNDKGSDNSKQIVDLIMSCASHPNFASSLRKIFPDLPPTVSGDTVEETDGYLASTSGKAGNDDADGKCQEQLTDISESVPNRVDSPDEPEFIEGVTPLHAQPDDQPDSNWSVDEQKLFFAMRDKLVIQRMSINDTSQFKKERFYKGHTGGNVNACGGSASAHGLSTTRFYLLPEDYSYEEQKSFEMLKSNRISINSIKQELDDLFESLSNAAYAKMLPDNCDLSMQVYKNGKQGHTRNFSAWQEGGQLVVGEEAPIQVGVQRQKVVLRLTAESLAMLNARLVYDEEIAFKERWINVSGDSMFANCIKKLIAQQKTDEKNVSQGS